MKNRNIRLNIVAFIVLIIGINSINNVQCSIKTGNIVDLNVNPGFEKITLEWSETGQIGFIDYKIYRGTTPNNQVLIKTITDISTTVYIDTDVVIGTEYFYNVTYTFDALASTGADPFTNSTIPGKIIGPISEFKFKLDNDVYNLTWTAPEEEDSNYPILKYNVYIGTSIDTLSLNGTTISSVPQYSFTNFDPTQTYYVKIAAVNAIGECNISNAFTIKKPFNLGLTIGLSVAGIGIAAVIGVVYVKKNRNIEPVQN